jgi:hypothetical protein
VIAALVLEKPSLQMASPPETDLPAETRGLHMRMLGGGSVEEDAANLEAALREPVRPALTAT